MGAEDSHWFSCLPDNASWPQELTDAVGAGKYIYWKHSPNWLVLLSTEPDDLVKVQGGGKVQARLAVNRRTGEVRHPTPGIPIGQWEAEVLGQLDEYHQRRQGMRDSIVDLADWKKFEVRPGIPRRQCP